MGLNHSPRQIREVCVIGAPKAHDAAELLFGAPKAPVICSQFVKYAEIQSRSDCYATPTRRSR